MSANKGRIFFIQKKLGKVPADSAKAEAYRAELDRLRGVVESVHVCTPDCEHVESSVVEETPVVLDEPVVEVAPVVEVVEIVEPAPVVKPKPKRTYRRRKTKSKE